MILYACISSTSNFIFKFLLLKRQYRQNSLKDKEILYIYIYIWQKVINFIALEQVYINLLKYLKR